MSWSHRKATRASVQLLIGITGPSGSGKTKSALRLADGMVRVMGGRVFLLDTENGRALHYADDHDFEHVPFAAPFSPLRYAEAVEYCVSEGAKVLIIDTLSHEHEGVGGVLEWHDQELRRLGGKQSQTFAAWVAPKQGRARMIQTLLRTPVHVILLFRAKEKLRIETGKNPIPLGWQPIAGEEYIYECTLHALLKPGSEGMWTLKDGVEHDAERAAIKIPAQFRDYFSKPRQFDEAIGEFMARWASGGAQTQPTVAADHPLLVSYRACQDADLLAELEETRRAVWPGLSREQKAALKAASDEAKAFLAERQSTAEEGAPC